MADHQSQLSGVATYEYKYGAPKSDGGDEAVPYMDDPDLVIDYSLLTSASSPPQKAANELRKFKSALSTWGCLQLINHGMSASFLDELRDVSRQFFAFSMEEKQRYALPEGGYNGYDCRRISDIENGQQIPEWNEGFSLTVYPEDRRKLEFWPEKPSKFKTLFHEYTTRMAPIFDELFKTALRSLDIDENKFGEQYGKNKEINARINFYTPCPGSNRGLGLKPHADFSAITLLIQDEEGLEILKDGLWFKVPVIPDALVLNLGDPTEIMCNGILKSAVHRAVTNAEKSRVSIALFWDADRNCQIGPLDELITSSRPQQYETVSLADYTTKFFQDYHSEERLIDSIRIRN